MPGDFSYRGGASAKPEYDQSVLLLEDCEGSNKWTAAGTGSDFVNLFDASWCYFGTKGWKLRTRATTPAADDQVLVSRVLTYPTVRRLIVRGRVNFSDVSLVKSFAVQFVIYNGSAPYQAVLWINPNTPTVAYMNSGGTYTTIPSLAFLPTDNSWYLFEIAMDLINWQYDYIRFGGTEFDMAGIPLYTTSSTAERAVYLGFLVIAIGAAQAEVGLDSVYLGAHDQL